MPNVSRSWKTAMYFFGQHGLGPFDCYFCGLPVDPTTCEPREFHIHHVDVDWTNNAADNLKPTHGRCHARHHALGRKYNERGTAATRSASARRGWETRRANGLDKPTTAQRAVNSRTVTASWTSERRAHASRAQLARRERDRVRAR